MNTNSSTPRQQSQVSIADVGDLRPAFEKRSMTDRTALEELLRQRWNEGTVFVGRMVRPQDVEAVGAYCQDQLNGVATWRVENDQFYVLTVNNITDQRGVATALLDHMQAMAREKGFKTLRVVISNDNWPAFRFYQKRGFRLVELHIGIVDAMRREVPTIPERGVEGIAMRDEFELEIAL